MGFPIPECSREEIPMARTLAALLIVLLATSPLSALEEWQPIGPDGATLLALAPSDAPSGGGENLVFAGGFLRPYRSLDGGLSWEPAGEPDFTFRSRALAPHPTNPQVVLAGLETFNFFQPIWRSENQGTTWTASSTGLPINGIVLSLFHDPDSTDTVYALLSENGPYRSTDGGQTWTALEVDVPGIDFDAVVLRQLLRDDAGRLYLVGTGLGMLVSADDGASWAAMNDGLDNRNFFQAALAPSEPGTFYALGVGELFRWRDGGPWQELLLGSPPGSVERLLVDPGSSSTLWVAGSQGIFQTFASDDLPTLWIGEATGLESAGTVFDLVLDTDDDPSRSGSLAATAAGSAIRQADRSWIEVREGLVGVDVEALLPVDTGERTELLAWDTTVVTTPNRFRGNLDRGAPWDQQSVVPLSAVRVVDLVRPSDEILLTATSGSLLRSTDGGTSWQEASLPAGVDGLAALASDGSGDGSGEGSTVYAASDAIPSTLLRSLDGGESFVEVARPGDNAVRALAIDPRDPARLWAATEGSAQDPGGLFHTEDGGESWSDVVLPGLDGSEADEGGAFALAIVPAKVENGEDDGTPWIYVGLAEGGVAISQDGGETWISTLAPLGGDVLHLVADPEDPARAYAADITTLARTTSGGFAWSLGPELPSGAIYDLDIDPRIPAQVYASISGRGLYRATFPAENAAYLQDERFQVTTRWTAAGGGAGGDDGPGRPVSLTADTGYFWFFDEANVELILKVLDGRAINGNFWVFYGALSNVEYAIRVADLDTGIESVYQNPSGTFASLGDTEAFPTAFPSPAVGSGVSAPLRNTAIRAVPLVLPSATKVDEPCVVDAENLCLAAERFRVEVDWQTPDGVEGRGQAEPLSADTGYFWFFDRDNVEVVAKVLDARAINGHFWVFYGALSNVEYTLRVTDTVTGTEWRYSNPLDTFASGGDVQAFPEP
jgi:photosystem II stability/assembly factor-like uncharacterized protein